MQCGRVIMKVAIIGAGPSGLVAARHLKECCTELDVYEKQMDIGGIWRDRENPGKLIEDDKNCSPVYDNLSTNTPRAVLEFDGLELKAGNKCFLHWKEVNKYLINYADKFGLHQHISLQSDVTKVTRENSIWKVTSCYLPSGNISEKYYDAVIVCNGHEEHPIVPQIEGASSFNGLKLHCKMYRNSKPFNNQNVLIIGAAISGIDICMEISQVANKVYLSHHRKKLHKVEFPENIFQKPDIKSMANNRVKFLDDSTEQIDSIIYCTGYKYNIDFLDKTCGVTLEKRYIKYLYKNMICIDHPSLMFFGLWGYYFTFPIMEIQAMIAVKLLTKNISLPTTKEMIQDVTSWEERMRLKGKNEHNFYNLYSDGREYVLELCTLGCLENPPEAFFEVYEACYYWNKKNPIQHRKNYYDIVDSKFIFKTDFD